MRIFLVSCLAIVVIAVGAVVVLDTIVQKTSTMAFASPTGVQLRADAH